MPAVRSKSANCVGVASVPDLAATVAVQLWRIPVEGAREQRFSTPCINETLKIGVRIADATAHAHAAGIVHSGPKRGNIMATGQELVKVLDFGPAKLMEAAAPLRTVLPPAKGL